MENTVTVKDMYDMMKSLNDCTKFAVREQTICAAMDTAIEGGRKPEELGNYERELRKRVPLDA